MAYGQTFQKLMQDLRAEIGHATAASVGQSENDSLKVLLQRTQEVLYDDYDWPHLTGVWKDVDMVAGQRYYTFPSGLNFQRAIRASVLWNGVWEELPVGFDTTAYTTYNSDDDERSDPPLRWRLYDRTQFEIWPIPATADATVRFIGTRALGALVADSDIADLDDRLIVLTAAAEKLAGKPRGKALVEMAAARLAQMKARAGGQARSFRPGENGDRPREHGVTIRIAGA